MKFRFDVKALIIFIIILIIEVLIALFVRDKIIRPYVGDTLVVMLIYYFFKTFIDVKPIYLIVAVVLFAFFVEFCQYMNLVEALGLQNNKFANTVIGNSFSWIDMLAYIAGGIILCFVELRSVKRS